MATPAVGYDNELKISHRVIIDYTREDGVYDMLTEIPGSLSDFWDFVDAEKSRGCWEKSQFHGEVSGSVELVDPIMGVSRCISYYREDAQS